MSEVPVIGLTGNIATGKTTVRSMLAQCGACVIDADQIVHRLLDSDDDVRAEVVARFDAGVQNADGSIDRGRLGRVVFADRDSMRDLEAILHPRVGVLVDELIADCRESVAVVEAIKLLESGLCSRCDAIWVTDCSEMAQVERLMQDRRMTRDEALARIRSQPSQAAKVAQADVVIDTSGSLNQTLQQVQQAWRKFTAARRS